MSNKNYQDIINRIYEIYKELGISAGDSSNTPSEDSIKSTAEKILNNLISNPANSVGESIEVIKNKVLQIKNNTENVNNYLAPLKQKFDNIYNELNSTSTSYMKGKVNGIYSTVLDIYNILFSSGSGSIEQSLESLKDRGKFTYYGDVSTMTLTKTGIGGYGFFSEIFVTDHDMLGFFDVSRSYYESTVKDKVPRGYLKEFRFKENKTKMKYWSLIDGVEGYRWTTCRYDHIYNDGTTLFELHYSSSNGRTISQTLYGTTSDELFTGSGRGSAFINSFYQPGNEFIFIKTFTYDYHGSLNARYLFKKPIILTNVEVYAKRM